MADATQNPDFRRLAESGQRPGISRSIGGAFCAARDAVACGLLAAGATPNHITIAGFLFTGAAGYCLARGASEQVPYFYSGAGPVGWWPAVAALFLILSGACDMLDGAAARIGRLSTPFGGILDSTLDRIGDMALFLGCWLHFALRDNLTYQVLALAVLCNSFLISYVKARAETILDDCSVGYWLRGERFAAVLIGCASGHVPAVLWQLAVLGALTVVRRVAYSWQATAALAAGRPGPSRGPAAGWTGRLQPWRRPRGSIAYDIVTGTNVAYIVFGPWLAPGLLGAGAWADPLRRWVGA